MESANISTESSDILDRKRLKERLKEATAVRAGASSFLRNVSFLEKVFGIRKADSRAGKERSRSGPSKPAPLLGAPAN